MSLKKRLQAKSAGVGLPSDAKDASAVTPTPATERQARTAPGQLMAFRGMMQETDAELERLRTELATRLPTELPLDQLHEAPGRRRKLDSADYQALKENLRRNPLVVPVTVRARGEGAYEIVSGHNRVAALKELGRTSVTVFILEANDEAAELSAFYANLLHPELPDYEKFQGFSKRLTTTGRSQNEVATEAGIDPSMLSRYMKFGALPESALAIIATAPARIGSRAVAELVALLPKTTPDVITQAVRGIVEEGLTQEEAVRRAKAGRSTSATSTRPAPTQHVVRSGRLKFCTVRARELSLNIEFSNEADRAAAEADLVSWLQARADG